MLILFLIMLLVRLCFLWIDETNFSRHPSGGSCSIFCNIFGCVDWFIKSSLCSSILVAFRWRFQIRLHGQFLLWVSTCVWWRYPGFHLFAICRTMFGLCEIISGSILKDLVFEIKQTTGCKVGSVICGGLYRVEAQLYDLHGWLFSVFHFFSQNYY